VGLERSGMGEAENKNEAHTRLTSMLTYVEQLIRLDENVVKQLRALSDLNESRGIPKSIFW
jgi:hypothetical protein